MDECGEGSDANGERERGKKGRGRERELYESKSCVKREEARRSFTRRCFAKVVAKSRLQAKTESREGGSLFGKVGGS